MNALIISLNFNPGHFSHLAANYKLLKDHGFSSYLYVNKSFIKMDEKNEFKKITHSHELEQVKKIDFAIFWFPSLRNIIEIIRLKYIFRARIVYIYHEPFDSIKNYYNSGFRFKKIAKICLINLVNLPVIFLSHQVVLPSSGALRLYEKKYTFFNSKYSLIPLLFDDESNPLIDATRKNSISYIGTIAADHAFDRFVAFVDSAIKNSWFPDQVFSIATSSVIPGKERAILNPYFQSGRVVLTEGHPMSTDEINGHYRNSFVVWNAYHRSMQSGVLPKAYMFGAAVIVQLKNSNEFIKDHQTGILINDNHDILEIKSAVEDVLKNRLFYFDNCRKMFLENFYYKANADKFMEILNGK